MAHNLLRAAGALASLPFAKARGATIRRVLDGRGEAIPLPDASAEGVFAPTAWHWLDPALAIPEIARVLRGGGRLGVIWTSRDRADAWVAELDLLRLPAVPGEAREREAGEPRTADQLREELDRHHSVTLPPDAPFGRAEAASFTFTRMMEVDDVVGWLATNSAFITAPARPQGGGSCAVPGGPARASRR